QVGPTGDGARELDSASLELVVRSADAGGVDDGDGHAPDHHRGFEVVTGRAWGGADHRALVPEQRVEEARLPRVRPAEHRQASAMPTQTPRLDGREQRVDVRRGASERY